VNISKPLRYIRRLGVDGSAMAIACLEFSLVQNLKLILLVFRTHIHPSICHIYLGVKSTPLFAGLLSFSPESTNQLLVVSERLNSF
jgi:hypothetical protein